MHDNKIKGHFFKMVIFWNTFAGAKVFWKVNWIIDYFLYPDSVNIYKLTTQ